MKEVFSLSAKEAALLEKYGLRAEALRGCSVRTYGFGEAIVRAGEVCRDIFVVVRGKAKVGLTAPNGRDRILCFYVSDGLIGEAEFFLENKADSTTVTALDDFRCVCIPLDANEAYLAGNLDFAHAAAAALAEKLLQRAGDVVEATLYTSEIRLCRYILAASGGEYFRDIMTDVASSVGISYRHLYRMMGALCRDGVLEKTGAGYHICDRAALEQRARQR